MGKFDEIMTGDYIMFIVKNRLNRHNNYIDTGQKRKTCNSVDPLDWTT